MNGSSMHTVLTLESYTFINQPTKKEIFTVSLQGDRSPAA